MYKKIVSQIPSYLAQIVALWNNTSKFPLASLLSGPFDIEFPRTED